MVVVALAHQDEVRARRAMERALARISVLAKQGEDGKRWDRAIIAFREHRFALAYAERRHSKWYRAYLRARS